MIFRSLTITCIILVASLNVQAQIFDKISSGIGKAINSSLGDIGDKVAEELAQRLIEAILSGDKAESESDSLSQYEQSDTSSTKAQSSAIDLSSIFGGSTEKVDKQFSFDYIVQMEVKSSGNTSNFTYYFPQNGTYVGSKMSNLLMVFDYESGESYTIVNDKLTSFNMKKIFEKNMVGQINEGEKYQVTKTGKSKSISGYNCEEYVLTTEDSEVHSWITKDFISADLNNSSIIKMVAEETSENLEQGFSMETIALDKKTNDTTTMTVKSIVQENKIIDLSQY